MTETGLINQIRNHYAGRIAKAEAEARARRVRAADNDDDDAVQAALRIVADELLPVVDRDALPQRYDAETLAVALGNHVAEVAADNGKAGYRRGYQQAQADAVPDDRAGAQAVYKEVFGNWPPREATVEEMAQACRRKVHAAALEVARSVARQLYGQAGRTVRNAEDLAEMVRARTEFEVRQATGETVHEGTTVHTPLRDEGIRWDTLRAVASWISQNWLTDLDFAPDDLTTPESLAARLQTAKDSERAVESLAYSMLMRNLGIPLPQQAVTLSREAAEFLIRRHISAESDRLARAADIRQDTIQEISDALVTNGFWRNDDDHRLTHTPVMPPGTTTQQFANRIHNQRTRTLVRRSNAHRVALLRELGQGDKADTARSVTDVARVISGMLDEQTALTAYRIIRESLGAKAAKPLLDEQAAFGDVTREAIILRARDIVAQAVAAVTGQLGEVVR